jgi:hypothetical protein
MDSTSFEFILPLVALYFAVVAFLTYLLIKVPSSYKIVWLAVPLFLVASFFSYQIYTEKLGQSFPTQLPSNEFMLIEARTVNQKSIEVWIKELNREHSRLIRLPYDSKTYKKLREALDQAKKSGIPQVGRRVPNKGKSDKKGDGLGEDLEFYNFPYERNLPKTDVQPESPLTPQ